MSRRAASVRNGARAVYLAGVARGRGGGGAGRPPFDLTAGSAVRLRGNPPPSAVSRAAGADWEPIGGDGGSHR